MPFVHVNDLTVEFPIYGTSSRSLKKLLVSQATGGRLMNQANEMVVVRALDKISFSIEHGERVALVGHNGSGKSTLLRVLAGIYKPSGGTVHISGSVGALLEPAAGMDPEATGVENIFLRGRVLGMSDAQISSQLDEIVEFTELANFIELPMRTYSAGMFARLAFAVSTAINPDILLIDEGIGAGDAKFMAKVQGRLQGMIDRSPILILASHDQTLVNQLCTRSIEFEHGQIRA